MRRAQIAILLFAFAVGAHATSPVVAVITDAAWSPGDAPREGAAEFEVLLRLAQLQQNQRSVGLIGIGDRHGMFLEGTQRAFEFAAAQGVPVVRLARGANAATAGTSELFIDGGSLSPEAASSLLSECLSLYGALPSLHSTAMRSESEFAAYQQKLQLYRAHFAARQLVAVAVR